MKLPRILYLYPVALAHIVRIFTVGLFYKGARYRIFRLAHEAGPFRCPFSHISIEDLVEDLPEFTLLAPKAYSGNVSLLELNALSWLAENRKAKKIFEFGTFDGRTALNLIAHSAKDAQLYTLDLPVSDLNKTALSILPHERSFVDKAASGLRFKGTSYTRQITQLLGDSATFDFSSYWGTMDLVFIDASHAYEYVKRDTYNALKLLDSCGGLLIWHDYGSLDWPDVRRALNEFYRDDYRFINLKQIEHTTLAILEVVLPDEKFITD